MANIPPSSLARKRRLEARLVWRADKDILPRSILGSPLLRGKYLLAQYLSLLSWMLVGCSCRTVAISPRCKRDVFKIVPLFIKIECSHELLFRIISFPLYCASSRAVQGCGEAAASF